MYVVWLVRAAMRIGYRNLTTPQLGAVVGLLTLVVGSTLGVMLQISYATGTALLPASGPGAHAETQISGYLVLVSISVAYWRLRGNDRTARGTWMVWLFFVGAAIIAIALLTNQIQAVAGYIPFDIAAFVLFLTLVWGRLLRPGWLAADSARHYAIAVPFSIVYIVVFLYIVVGFIVLELWPTFEDIPTNLIPATEHPLFVGMVTNILFGMLFDLTRDRPSIWPWADHVVFWGINAAVTAFTIALLADVEGALPFVTPVLGLSILVGIVTYTRRLWAAPASPAMAAPG